MMQPYWSLTWYSMMGEGNGSKEARIGLAAPQSAGPQSRWRPEVRP